jgi:hypothetical protein
MHLAVSVVVNNVVYYKMQINLTIPHNQYERQSTIIKCESIISIYQQFSR